MSILFLVEATLASADALTTLAAIADRVGDRGGHLLEAEVTPSGQLSAILEAEDLSEARAALEGLDVVITDAGSAAVSDSHRDDNLVFRAVLAHVVEPSIPLVPHARRRNPAPQKGRRPCPSHQPITESRALPATTPCRLRVRVRNSLRHRSPVPGVAVGVP